MGCGALEVGIPLMLAGTGAQIGANVMEGNAMNSKVSAELARQSAFQKRGTGVFQQSLGQSTPQAAQQQIGQGQQQYTQAMQGAKLPMLSQPGTLPNDTSRIIDTATQARNNMSNMANANLQGYGNYGLQQHLKDLQAGSQLGVIGNEAQQSAGVLPTELAQARQSQAGLSSIGQLLSTVGSLAGMYGLMSPAAAAPTAAAQTGGSLGLDATWFPTAADQATVPFSFANAGQAALNPMNFGAGFSPFASGSDLLSNLGYGAPLSLPYQPY